MGRGAFSLLDVFIGRFKYQRWRTEGMCAFFGSQDDLGDLSESAGWREGERGGGGGCVKYWDLMATTCIWDMGNRDDNVLIMFMIPTVGKIPLDSHNSLISITQSLSTYLLLRTLLLVVLTDR